MRKETLGLVIASYKYGHLAAHAIETALSQTIPFDAIYFVDDGAGDCEHLLKIYGGEKIKFVLRKENKGIVDNFNDILYNIVNTDYIMFMGADNWLTSDACEWVKKGIDNKEFTPAIITSDIIITGVLRQELFNTYRHEITGHDGDYYWSRDGKHHGSMAYDVELAKQVSGYAHNKTSSRTDEDMNLWDKMIAAGAKVHHFRQAFLYYRRHKENYNKY
jgi:glycosyltransferase involved in cell wall biosynthesis